VEVISWPAHLLFKQVFMALPMVSMPNKLNTVFYSTGTNTEAALTFNCAILFALLQGLPSAGSLVNSKFAFWKGSSYSAIIVVP
jgi:hypothetical protein